MNSHEHSIVGQFQASQMNFWENLLRDSKGEWRCLVNLFKRQGAAICDERVQAKLREAEDIGTCVKDHLLNVFDCLADIHDNCLGDCKPRKVSAATKRELQAAKKRMRDKLDL